MYVEEATRSSRAMLILGQNLRSAEEMEEEEREAQSAKLQELIRRGGPQDLQEANKLMKVMAGYDTRNKTDWRAKAAEEVSRIQQKARILEEMLQGYRPGDEIKEGDVFEVPQSAGLPLARKSLTSIGTRQRASERSSEDTEDV
jgi:ADP-ribosylation factor-binding protein GGA